MVAVALRIMRDEGLERLTMRRLAAELDTGAASLYVYVRNTAELHGAVLDELVAELELPEAIDRAPEWREQLIGVLCAYNELLFAYPSLARSALVLRPSGPHFLGLIDAILRLLDAGGVPVRQAAWGVDILLQQATAMAAEHSTRDQSVESGAEEQDLGAAVAEATPELYPNIVRVREEILSGTWEQRRRWAFATLLDGLVRHP